MPGILLFKLFRLLIVACAFFSAHQVPAATVLLVVGDSATPTSTELGLKAQLESWGYTVNLISDHASQGAFDTAIAAADVAYVPTTVTGWELGYKLRTAPIGVLCEEIILDNEFGFITNDGWANNLTQIEIVNNTHEITAGLSLGILTITTSSQPLAMSNGTLAPDFQVLAKQSATLMTFGVIEKGGTLANTYNGNSTASGRRVRMPMGGDSFNYAAANSTLITLAHNAIKWAIGKQKVARWKLNETSGTSAADATGNGHTGTVTGTATWTSAVRNNGFSFNGSTRIQASGLMNNPKNVTLAAWINLTAADSGGSEIISLGDHVAIRADDGGNLRAFFYNGSSWESISYPTTVAGNGWHHVATTFDDDANQFRLFLNGVLVASAAPTTSISYSGLGSNTVIGRHGNGGTTFDFTGVIDDVCVYNYALTPSEVAELYGFLGQWKLDETSGTTANDLSPVSNDGTYLGGVLLNQSGPHACAGEKAADLDGTNDRVSAAVATSALLKESVTIAGWVRLDAYTQHAAILENGSSSSYWNLSFESDGRFRLKVLADQVASDSPVGLGTWCHLAATYDGVRVRLYYDGQLVKSQAKSWTLDDFSGSLTIGSSPIGTSEYLNGRLHDVRFYNRALSAGEIAALYGAAGFWKFDEGTGSSAADSAAGNNATLSGGATWTTSCSGHAALFTNGTGGIAQTSSAFAPPATGTVVFWMRSTGTPAGTARIFGLSDMWEVRQNNDGTVSFDLCGDATPNVITTIPLNEAGRWYHVAAVFDSTNDSYAIYIDGQLDKSGTNSNPMSQQAAGILSFGTRTGSTEYWSGALRDFRVYSYKLCPAEIAEIYGLVGWWKLDETSGVTAYDSSLCGRNGTYAGGVTLNTTGPKSGLVAAQFDGSNDHVALPTYQTDFTNGYTIAVWAQPTSSGYWARFLELGAGENTNNFFLTRWGTTATLNTSVHNGAPVQRLDAANTVVNGAWHHYAATVNASGDGKLYLDGAEVASGFTGLPIAGTRTNNYIGRSNWAADAYYNGKMWDARLYNRCLCPTEIQMLYKAGTASGVRIIRWVEIQ